MLAITLVDFDWLFVLGFFLHNLLPSSFAQEKSIQIV